MRPAAVTDAIVALPRWNPSTSSRAESQALAPSGCSAATRDQAQDRPARDDWELDLESQPLPVLDGASTERNELAATVAEHRTSSLPPFGAVAQDSHTDSSALP